MEKILLAETNHTIKYSQQDSHLAFFIKWLTHVERFFVCDKVKVKEFSQSEISYLIKDHKSFRSHFW